MPKKQFKKRRPITFEYLSKDRKDIGQIEFIRRKVNSEARKQINIMIEMINTRNDLEQDTAVKALSTLKSLYLIDFELEIDIGNQVRVKRWFSIEKDYTR